MDDDEKDPAAILANPNHPIWKVCLAMTAILAAAWGMQSGTI